MQKWNFAKVGSTVPHHHFLLFFSSFSAWMHTPIVQLDCFSLSALLVHFLISLVKFLSCGPFRMFLWLSEVGLLLWISRLLLHNTPIGFSSLFFNFPFFPRSKKRSRKWIGFKFVVFCEMEFDSWFYLMVFCWAFSKFNYLLWFGELI